MKTKTKMKKSFDFDIAIIGGGASGLAAALTAAGMAPQLSVAVFEKKETAGRKLSASGNGRCNLSNVRCEHLEEVMDFFGKAGIALRRDDEGRIYPYSEEAAQVTSALTDCILGSGAKIFLNSEITGMEALPEGGFLLFVGGNHENPRSAAVRARTALIAAGGKSYASMGTTGDGYVMARKLGHRVEKLVPALTAVEVSEDLSSFKGVRTKAEVSLFKEGRMIFSEKGEVQFREDSLSGICIMNMSRHIKRQESISPFSPSDGFRGYEIIINPVADFDSEELKNILEEKFSIKGLSAAQALKTLVKKPLADRILNRAEISCDENGSEILRSTEKKNKLISELSAMSFSVTGLKGWNEAQVTSGGVSPDEVDSVTMESKLVEGLFFSGEVLDYDGPCGGYNLHHAWFTGIRAGKGMAVKCTESIR